MADAVRCAGRAVGQVAGDGCRAARDDAGARPRRATSSASAPSRASARWRQRLLGVRRAQGGEPVAREERALGGAPGRHPPRRRRSAAPGCRAAHRRAPSRGRRRRRRPAGRPRRAPPARPGADEHEHRCAAARDDERSSPVEPSKPAAVERRAVEVGAEVARAGRRRRGTSTATASSADGVEGGRRPRRRPTCPRRAPGCSRRGSAGWGCGTSCGSKGRLTPTLAPSRTPVTGIPDRSRRPGLESRA